MQICTYHADKIGLISFMSLCFYGVALCVIKYKRGSISFLLLFVTRNIDLCFVRKYMQTHIYTCSCVLEQRKESALHAY